MCQCARIYYTLCGHIKEEKCNAPNQTSQANRVTNGVNGSHDSADGVNGARLKAANGANGGNGVVIKGFGAVGEVVPKICTTVGPRGHVGRPLTPPKLMYFCTGMPGEPKVMEQSCPDCFFR